MYTLGTLIDKGYSMSSWSKGQIEDMMRDCVDVIYPHMTESIGLKYGQGGYSVDELISEVLEHLAFENKLLNDRNEKLKKYINEVTNIN